MLSSVSRIKIFSLNRIWIQSFGRTPWWVENFLFEYINFTNTSHHCCITALGNSSLHQNQKRPAESECWAPKDSSRTENPFNQFCASQIKVWDCETGECLQALKVTIFWLNQLSLPWLLYFLSLQPASKCTQKKHLVRNFHAILTLQL